MSQLVTSGGYGTISRKLTPSSAVNFRRSRSDIVSFMPPDDMLKAFYIISTRTTSSMEQH
jgi:hypothetical protein